MGTIERNGVLFNDSTPDILQDVVLECIDKKTLVHILTGDPLTGYITPHLNAVGYVGLSPDTKSVPIFRTKWLFSSTGERLEVPEIKRAPLNTERILKINEVDTCQLLYQSYECKASSLHYVCDADISPYGDIKMSARLECSNPERVIYIPVDADVKQICDFLFGKTHYLPGFFDTPFDAV